MMEKYCINCGRVFKDSDFISCPYCQHPLDEREGRQHIPKGLRHAVFKRDGYRCKECFKGREDGVKLEIDHIVPVAKGGTNDIDNLQTLCKECNRNKHTNEWIAGETDLEVVENEYYSLLDKKQRYEEKLDGATNEDDIIEYKFAILKLDETLDIVNGKLQNLRFKRFNLIRQQEEKERKNKLFKKLYITLPDSKLKLLYSYFTDIPNSRDDIISYLVDNFSENDINQILIKLEKREELFKELSANLTKPQLELLYNYIQPKLNLVYSAYASFEYSQTEFIYYLCDNYHEEEIYLLLNKLQMIKERKNKLSNNLTNDQLELLYCEFTDVEHSRESMVSYLCDNFSDNEINQILIKLQKEKEEMNNLSDNISNDILLLLYKAFPLVTPSREPIVDYLYHNFSKDEINELLIKLQKELEEKVSISNRITDGVLILLYEEFPQVHSKESMVEYLYDNCSKVTIDQLLTRLQKESNILQKRKLIKGKLSNNLTDAQLELLYYKFPNVIHSKEHMTTFLSENYSESEIDQMLVTLQKELPKKISGFESYKITDDELKQRLTSEHLRILGLIDSACSDKDYVIAWFPLGFTRNQTSEIMNELDNIIVLLDELNNQKDNVEFCILGFNNIWYYYYLAPNGEYKRFYAFSKSELEEIAFSKNLHWYKRFIFTCSSNDSRVCEFIGDITSKINTEVVGIPNVCYYGDSINSISNKAHDEVISRLNAFSENEPPEELFKPTILPSEFLPEFIQCPKCGSTIQRNAVRCKHCKTMMKELVEKAGGELELCGFDSTEIKIVEK